MHDNPYLNLFQGFKFNINEQTTKQEAVQISRQLGHIHNATGIIIADLIKCLGFKYQISGHSNLSTPSTQLKDIQNQSNFQIENCHLSNKNQNEFAVNNDNKLIQENKSVDLDGICDQKRDAVKNSCSIQNPEPFQVFEYKNVNKKLQKQLKKIDKQKINSAIQKAKGVRSQQIKFNQNQKQQAFFKQNKFKIVNLEQKLKADNNQTYQKNIIQDKANIPSTNQLNQKQKCINELTQLNKFAFLNQKIGGSTVRDFSKKALVLEEQFDLNENQQNLMIQEVFQENEEYQKIGEDFSFGGEQPDNDQQKKIQTPSLQQSKEVLSKLIIFEKNIPQSNLTSSFHHPNTKSKDKKQQQIIQILSDDQN